MRIRFITSLSTATVLHQLCQSSEILDNVCFVCWTISFKIGCLIYLIWIYVAIYCMCRPRSYHWNPSWNTSNKGNHNKERPASLFPATEPIWNCCENSLIHTQDQPISCGVFWWLPLIVEHENLEERVSVFYMRNSGSHLK